MDEQLLELKLEADAAVIAASIVARRLADGYRPDGHGGWCYTDEHDYENERRKAWHRFEMMERGWL